VSVREVAAIVVALAVSALDGAKVSPSAFVEWYMLDGRQQASAAAIAAVVMDDDVICVADGCAIRQRPVPKACVALESHADAGVIEHGTAFLIERRTVVTAGHVLAANHMCAPGASARALRFVFDYRMTTAHTIAAPAEDSIYAGNEVVTCSVAPDDDVAVVSLRREAVDREPLRRRRQALSPGERIWSLGHPLGLPLKYSEGTLVDTSERRLHGRLAVTHGSSGAPVFDSEGAVFGVIVSVRVPAAVTDDSCAAIEYCAGRCLASIEPVP